MVKIEQSTFRILILCILMISWITCANAQEKIDEVTLTVIGEGSTKQEATTVALRNAIEQTFGTFVSANTAVLNDELVKDEIVTLSSGNVKNYDEIASMTFPDGRFSVTIKATIVLSKLITYSESKGFSVEFAGQAFAMNMKLKELNKRNEVDVVKNLIQQASKILPYIFDYELELQEPVQKESLINGKKYVYYDIETTSRLYSNSNTENFHALLLNTLKSISLSQSETEEYKKINIPYYHIDLSSGEKQDYLVLETFYFRSLESIYYMEYFLTYTMTRAILNFQIVDNLNNSSILSIVSEDDMKKYELDNRVDKTVLTLCKQLHKITWDMHPTPQNGNMFSIPFYIIPQGLFRINTRQVEAESLPQKKLNTIIWPHLKKNSQGTTLKSSLKNVAKDMTKDIVGSFGIKKNANKKGKTTVKEQIETKNIPRYLCYTLQGHLAIPLDSISKYTKFEIKRLSND